MSNYKNFRIVILSVTVLLSLGLIGIVPRQSLVQAASSSQDLVPQSGSIQLSEFETYFSAWVSAPDSDSQLIDDPSVPGKLETPKYVYLTFDDGPDPKWTPQILTTLTRHNAKATFFVIGSSARTYPDVILQQAQAGQMLANHSFNHVKLPPLSYSDFTREVKNTEIALRDALQAYPELDQQVALCLRPPYGEVSPNVWTFAYRLLYDVSMWSLDTNDWMGISAEKIRDRVLQNVKPGSVILMHDGGKERSETVRALGLVLHELTLRGWEFRPLCTSEGQQNGR
ncbi:MAG: polysaccharide deacetylase family protein [Anaerolineaceae bacterium]|nr:polysaccharide deacetylase family protein [Anaerolineaceae bacterium]